MGQSASNQREQDRSNISSLLPLRRRSQRISRPSSNLQQSSEGPTLSSARGTSASPQPHSRRPSTGLLATFTRQISSSSVRVAREISTQATRSGPRDAILYEQQEDRPFATTQDLGLHNTPITHITASPMPRRSRLSRLSSMIMSRDASSERLGDHHNQEENWQRPLTRDSLEIARQAQWDRSLHQNARPSDPLVGTTQRGRSQLVSRPISQRADSPMPSANLSPPLEDRGVGRSLAFNHAMRVQSSDSATPQLSRLTRIRRSISQQVENPSLTNQSPTRSIYSSPRQERAPRSSSPARGFTPLTTTNFATESEHNEIISHPGSSTGRQVERVGGQDSSDLVDMDTSPGRHSSWADRLADLSHGGRRENRRASSMLSARSTRLLRRDQDGPLPRILNLAAFALAARLAGSNPRSTQEIRSVGADATDGNIQNLLQALQNAVPFTPAEMTAAENGEGTGRPTGPTNPLSYLRVFRFVSIAAAATTNADSSSYQGQTIPTIRTDDNQQRASSESMPQDSEGRTVTLVVIGIRSIPSDDTFREASPNLEPLVDSLLAVPSLASSSNVLGAQQVNTGRSTNGTQRLPHSRPTSSGGSSPFLVDLQNQRRRRTSSFHGTQSADDTFDPDSATLLSLPTSDSPPGPRPPPSTPADTSLSAYSSQVTTPSRRPSSASFIQQGQNSVREAASPRSREISDPLIIPHDQTTTRVHHRRRSDSEFARNRDLGAGASRRNGVVAPDEADNPGPSVSRSRSWLIYVVGTNIAEDHPALTAPSLFTDNPSYEDMLLLSTLLGPVRPPVASPEEVSSAGGLYRVCDITSPLTAESIQGDALLPIGPDERCLVCLENYRPHEHLRRLNECSHVFHRACIDEWLTTGRNSCPLCRGQGVSNEKPDGESQSA